MGDLKFATALLVNDLARDLMYLNERLNLDSDAVEEIYGSGILPRLAEASESYAALLKITWKRKPPVRESGSAEDTIGANG